MSSTTGLQRIGQLFHAALERPPEAWDSFLATACEGDEALRREVVSLLAAHAAAGGFLERAAFRIADSPAEPAWALQAGARIGNFEVLAPIGAGGMGEVYRARDTRLGRDVAIKVLPPTLAADPQRLARFERESRILASLNHPNIATIHGVEQANGLPLLILELVEGPTLADRLAAGPVPVNEALDVARQLIDGLEAAHERGIVHRDLKPANVKVSPDGRVIVLDFGLAKEHLPASAHTSTSNDPLQSTAGLILGTCAYMSPEQARGNPVDKRTDIWAFGCILFEMLSGRRAFGGATASDTIAAVLERPPDWRALPAIPAALLRLLRHCLEKEPRRRLHDIADARIYLDDLAQAADEKPAAASSRDRRKRWPIAAAAIAAVVATTFASAGWLLRGRVGVPPAVEREVRFTWSLPPGVRLTSPPTVAPDGRHIAFAASADAAPPRLYVRALNALDATVVPRTDGADQPFWSPDSRSLGYFARGKLMKIALAGGAPVELADTPNPRGGAWGRDDVIVFAPDSIYSGLARVPAAGGTPQPATLLDAEQGDNAHRWPAFLPDGVHFVYFVRSLKAERRGVYLRRVDQPAAVPGAALFRSESEAVFAPLDAGGRGALFSVADGHVTVHPFDAKRLELTGDPRVLPVAAGGNTPRAPATLSVSSDIFTHVPAPIPYGQRLVSTTVTGGELRQHTEPTIVNWPRLSPDGTRLVSQQLDPLTGSPDLWVEDLQRGTRLRATKEGTSGQLPIWSADGLKLAYVAGPSQQPVLTIGAADGTGEVTAVACPHVRCEPTDWSRDGRWMLVNAWDADGRNVDVWLLSLVSDVPHRPIVTSSAHEHDARFSPDGGLIAYVSDESGRPEILIRTVFDRPARREVVSVAGGTQPVWRRNGPELFFVDLGGALRRASVSWHADGRPLVRNIQPVDIPLIGTGHFATQYDVSPDGERVYFLDRELPAAPREIGVILGWRALVR